jgi:biopolymer transport protein ExbD
MDFADLPRKPRAEAIVPMINVVFLLLIFFLMTSQIAPPDPFDIETPVADQDEQAVAEQVLFIDASGRLHFDGAEDDAAMDRLSYLGAETTMLVVKADARLEARVLAVTLASLSGLGFANVELVVTTR